MNLFLGKDNVGLLKISQNDYGKEISIKLYDSNCNIYNNTSDSNVFIEWLKPNNKAYIQDKDIVFNNGIITFKLHNQVTLKSGEGKFNIVFKNDDIRESTFISRYKVIEGAIEGKEIDDVFTTIIKDIEDKILEGNETENNIKEAIKKGNISNMKYEIEKLKEKYTYKTSTSLILNADVVMEEGNYKTSNNTINIPFKETGTLEVKVIDDRIIQVYTRLGNKYMYIRSYYNNDWTGWSCINNDSDYFDFYMLGNTTTKDKYYLVAEYNLKNDTRDFSETLFVSRSFGNYNGDTGFTIINLTARTYGERTSSSYSNNILDCTFKYLTPKITGVDFFAVVSDDGSNSTIKLYIRLNYEYMVIKGKSAFYTASYETSRKYYKTGDILDSLPYGTLITPSNTLVENIIAGTQKIPNGSINLDSTHRFTTDTEKDVWNSSVYSETVACSVSSTVKVNMKYTNCKHVKVTFSVGNKENNSNFNLKVNNTVNVRQETGGGTILYTIDFYRNSGDNWIYIVNGFIAVTSAGDYVISNAHGSLSSLGNLTSVSLVNQSSSDNYEMTTAFIEYYK